MPFLLSISLLGLYLRALADGGRELEERQWPHRFPDPTWGALWNSLLYMSYYRDQQSLFSK